MADQLNVERLFALPYFQQMFDQMIKPMAASFDQIIGAKTGVDPALLTKASETANQYVYHGMLGLMMNFYVETLTDDEVDFLREAYQHPVFMKLQASASSMLQLMVAWFTENQALIEGSIEAAIAKAA